MVLSIFPFDHALTASGIILSSDHSPPPITFPARAEPILMKELLFNITRHVLIPEMRLLNNDEINQVVKKIVLIQV